MARPDCNRDGDASDPSVGSANAPRPYIGVYFECCGVYTRVYRRPWKMEYYCRCPRCLRTARVRVGPEGTATRLFRAR